MKVQQQQQLKYKYYKYSKEEIVKGLFFNMQQYGQKDMLYAYVWGKYNDYNQTYYLSAYEVKKQFLRKTGQIKR